MKNWLRQHRIAFQRTLGAMARQPVTHIFNLLVIGIAAAFPLVLWLAVSSVAGVIEKMPVEPQLTAFLRSSVTADEAQALRDWAGKDSRLASHRYISKEDALKDLQASSGFADLIAGLPSNPLPDAIVFTAKENKSSSLEALQKELSVKAGVEEVQLDSAWARRLENMVALGRAIFEALAVLLGAALVLITGNTIRMQILTRHEEIEVAKLIGATDAFIRRPFIHFAAAQGLFGGLFACGISWLIIGRLNPAVSDLATAYGQQFSLLTPSWSNLLLVCSFTTSLCLAGAWIAVWRHLRRYL